VCAAEKQVPTPTETPCETCCAAGKRNRQLLLVSVPVRIQIRRD
jgi:hypothetical protein